MAPNNDVDLDSLLSESSAEAAPSPDSRSGDIDLDALLQEGETGSTPTAAASPAVDIGSLISQASASDSSPQGIPEFLQLSLGERVATLLSFMGSMGENRSLAETDPKDFSSAMGNIAGIVPGLMSSGIASPFLQTAGTRLNDLISQKLGFVPEQSSEDFLTQTTAEGGKNVALDLLFRGAGKGISRFTDKFFPGREAIAKQAIEIPETFAAKATGQGAMASQASMGGLDNAAEFAASAKPWDVNVYQAAGFDKETGKFIPKANISIRKVRDFLTSATTRKEVASTKNSFINALDEAAQSAKKPSFDGTRAADELQQTVDSFDLVKDSVDPENQQIAASIQGRIDPYITSIRETPTFKNLQARISEIDKTIRRLGGYDDPNKLASMTKPSSSIEEVNALKTVRNQMRDMMTRFANEGNEIFGSAVPAKAGLSAGDYLDRLNTAYQATRIVGDDFDELVRQLSRSNTTLSDRALKNPAMDVFNASRPVMSIANSALGGFPERFREMGVTRTLDKKLPQFIQDVTDLKSGQEIQRSQLEKYWGSSVDIFNRAANPIARQAIPAQAFMSTVNATLAPEEAHAIETQLQQAGQSADPLADERVMGSAVAMFPELRSSFAPPKSMANSEWAGLIADPAEKIVLKGKLLQHVQAGEVDSITAAKFAQKLNKDEPFTSVPAPLRGRGTQPALPSEPAAPSYSPTIQSLAPDLAQPLDLGLPPGLPTLQ